ncbi:MAG: alpha/beta hydrolase [Candidatus Binatia bacterium]
MTAGATQAGGCAWERQDSDFPSRGLRCSAWLYRPEGVAQPPLVIMAHGFGAEKGFGLPAYAERFAAAGLAVLVFDYRCFGSSEGQPRNWVSPRRHLEDWEAAIEHAKALEGIDGSRIALWGTSFSGGHVVVVASRHPELRAIVAQVPLADGRAALATVRPGMAVKMIFAGLLDLLSMVGGRPPHTLPIVGEPDSFAVLNTEGCWEGIRALIPKDSPWQNACPARVVFSLASYRPTKYAARVRCPALVMPAERDRLIPYRSVEKEAAKMPKAELVPLACEHFDPYLGERFERVVRIQRDFLSARLA